MAAEALGVDGGGGDDDFQIGAAREELLEIAEEEIDVEAALVGFVDDERVVLLEDAIALRLGQQDAIGHDFDASVLAYGVREADFEADFVADVRSQFLRDAGGDGAGGDAAGLGVADQCGDAAIQLEADFGELSGFAGAGFAADDDDLVGRDRVGDFAALLDDGQFFWKSRARKICLAVLFFLAREFDLVGDDIDEFAGGPAGFEELTDALDFAAEEALVAEHAVGEGGFERGEIDWFFRDRFGEALVHWGKF